MKTFLLLLSVVLSVTTIRAQDKNIAEPHLLKHYYELKDALVNSDAATAAYRITDLINASNNAVLKIPDATRDKLAAAGNDLAKQRAAFAKLSLDMYQLARTQKLSGEIIYQQYCPMKKMYWLSREAAIRNPYYGKAMLTCGNLAETIKP
ncbi:MAG: hypothetical protein JWQ78_1472 [Sediminibacterium sp.]|nr:hypothetical protein [Sediminibacterium sp.]